MFNSTSYTASYLSTLNLDPNLRYGNSYYTKSSYTNYSNNYETSSWDFGVGIRNTFMNKNFALDIASYSASYLDFGLYPAGTIISKSIGTLNYSITIIETIGYGIHGNDKEYWRGIATLSGALLGGIRGGMTGAYIGSFAAGMAYSRIYDPIVLDLDLDGVELVEHKSSKVYFDMNSGGNLNVTGWIGPHDGILVLDLNKNGKIDNLNEVFSEKFNGGSDSGFGALSTLDKNSDGRFNAQDEAFTQVRVWRDLNQNGVSESGELFSLSSLNISSIDLTNIVTTERNVDGNVIHRESSATMTNGARITVADVGFLANTTEYTYEGLSGGIRRYKDGDGRIVGVVDADTGATINLNSAGLSGIIGGMGNDSLTAGNGNGLMLNGLAGNDTITGGAGNDFLMGGDGADRLSAGAGDDLIMFDRLDALVDGGEGNDVAMVASAA